MDQAQDSNCALIKGPDGTPTPIGSEDGAHLTGAQTSLLVRGHVRLRLRRSRLRQQPLCSRQERRERGLAVTVDTSYNDLDPKDAEKTRTAVTLCPLAFTDENSQDTIRSKTIRSRMRLATVQPKSLTLLHEIFHALFGGQFDSGGEENYGVAECIERARGKLSGREALRNPDNWSYFALAMYYLYEEDSNGKRWDFSSGYAKAV
ncbi:hypothetical protein VTK56DRAFT_6496 [Thermocarpiscus australiensis]